MTLQADDRERQMRLIAPILRFTDDLTALGWYDAAEALGDAIEPLVNHMGLEADDLTIAREHYPEPAEPFWTRGRMQPLKRA